MNTSKPKILIYDTRGNGVGAIRPTITGDHENRITDYTAIVVIYEKTYEKINFSDTCAECDVGGNPRASGGDTGGWQ